ncbi:hypothetical protein BHE74_00052018, partial [Ensete ventricosum]
MCCSILRTIPYRAKFGTPVCGKARTAWYVPVRQLTSTRTGRYHYRPIKGEIDCRWSIEEEKGKRKKKKKRKRRKKKKRRRNTSPAGRLRALATRGRLFSRRGERDLGD